MSAAFDDPTTVWDVSYSGVQQLMGASLIVVPLARVPVTHATIFVDANPCIKGDATTIFGNRIAGSCHWSDLVMQCCVVALAGRRSHVSVEKPPLGLSTRLIASSSSGYNLVSHDRADCAALGSMLQGG